MSESELKVVGKKEDSIEIPIGKWLESARKNPWVLISLVLAVVLIGALVSSSGTSGIGADVAGQKVIEFINAQGQGSASLISAAREGDLYNIVLDYQGQEVPIYATLDGEFLVSSLIPIGSTPVPSNPDSGGNTGENVQVSGDDDAVLGNADAPVTIIEFSDFQCPFCGRFWSETLPQIKSEYIDTGKAKLVFRDFPLTSIHPNAQKAAEAAECVRAQSDDATYFEYHDKLFENQGSLEVANLKKWADDLGYDIGSCLDSGKFASEVQKDAQDAQAAGGQGTPYFIINGQTLSGAQPFSAFKQIIDAQLAAA